MILKIGGLYRNKWMRDVDFWVSNHKDGEYTGYWVQRLTGKILTETPDKIKGLRLEDWVEVVDA